MLKVVLLLIHTVLFFTNLQVLAQTGEWLVGVSPRNGDGGPAELRRWEGKGKGLPSDWTGRPADLIGLSLGGAANWGSLAEYGVNHLEDVCGWKNFDRKKSMEIALPLFPTGYPVDAKVWRKALANEVMNAEAKQLDEHASFQQGGWSYLAYFRHLANILVRNGYGESTLRLGWEFNGNWFEWGLRRDLNFRWQGQNYDHARAYSELYRKVHDAMMSVEGARFRWSWNVSVGGMSYGDEVDEFMDYRRWFPGKEFVDFVSVDCFDDEPRYYPGRSKGPEEDVMLRLTWLAHLLRFEGIETSLCQLLETLGADMQGKYPWSANEVSNEQLSVITAERFPTYVSLRDYVLKNQLAETGRPGVQWFRDFANENGLGFLISEWGVWENDPHEVPQIHFSGGDNAESIRLMAQWLRENPPRKQLGGVIYFEEFNDLSQPGERKGFNHSLLDGNRFPKARAAYVEEFVVKGLSDRGKSE